MAAAAVEAVGLATAVAVVDKVEADGVRVVAAVAAREMENMAATLVVVVLMAA